MTVNQPLTKLQRQQQIKQWLVMASADGSTPNAFSLYLLEQFYVEGKLSLNEIDDIVTHAVKEFR